MNRLYSTLTPFTLLILISAPYLGYLTVYSEGANETQPIDLTITEFEALRDDYDKPMRNPDGTFYPGDGFKVRYYVWTGVNVTFDRLEAKYDGSVFEPLTSTNNERNFKIRKTASEGRHEVKFVAHGTYTYTVNYTDPETNSTVTEVVHKHLTDEESVTVEVVAYEPRFTVPLSYLVLKADGKTSFEKPFAVIARYDGNGPDCRLDQRALVEYFTWEGYALKAIYDRDAKGFVEVAKPLQEFSSSAQPILRWLNKPEAPLTLQGEGRYVKLIIDIDESVMNEVLNQNYTYVCLNVTFWSSSFTPEPTVLFTANYTYTPETFVQPILLEACRPTEKGWEADSSVHVKAKFTPATNVTTKDIYSEWFKNQTNDETALKMALKDIYETGPQIFSGFGAVDGELLKTSPLLYNLTVTAESYGRTAEVRRVVYMSFRKNESYKIYVNLLGGGVDVKVIDDSGQYAYLKVSALPEAGGLSRILVYDQKGGLIKAENVSSSPATQQGILGFYGEHSLVLAKSPSMGKKLTIETRNVWGATTRITVEVESYSKPPLPAIEELGYWLFLLVAAAIAFSLTMFFLRGGKT